MPFLQTQNASKPDRQAHLIAALQTLASASHAGTKKLSVSDPAKQRTIAQHRYFAVLVGLCLLLGLVSLAGLMLGSVHIPATTAIKILANALLGDGVIAPDWRHAHEIIVIQSRVPRVILAAIVGGSLGATGMTIQAIVRNPLAGPSILGVSSGAATGAVIVMRWGLIGFGVFTLHISAFLGGLITLAIVFWVARTGGQITPTRLVLAGVAMSAILSALTSMIVLTSPDPQLASRVLFWTLGGFGTAQWKLLPLPTITLFVGLIIMLLQARRLNLLLAGDESAIALGLDVVRFRKLMFLLTAAMTGIMVSLAGVISFVGLVMPHIIRFLVGADHRRALIAVTLLGASFTVAADLLARTIISPLELPVGIVTSLVGGPFFIWLLRRDARSQGLQK